MPRKDLVLKYGCPPYRRIKDVETEFFPEKLSPYFRKSRDRSCLVLTNYFFNNKKVLDVYRYDLRHCYGDWMLFKPKTNTLATLNPSIEKPCKDDLPIEENKEANNILIILESPHKDEYCDKCFTPLAPANGDTGENFIAYFASPCINGILNKLMKDHSLVLDHTKIYRICFVNPVPFQASLHFIHENHIQSILKNIPQKKQKKQKKDTKKDSDSFKSQIKEKVWKELFYLCKKDFIRRVCLYHPDIIINACTDKLKSHIKLEIDDKTINYRGKFNTLHPSSWHGHLTNDNICSIW